MRTDDRQSFIRSYQSAANFQVDPTSLTKEEIEVLSAIDLGEYYVDKIVVHDEKGRNPKNWKFIVRWVGYEPEDDF